MDWKKQFTEIKKGDTVMMIKPCPECRSMNPTKCWEEDFKDRKLVVDYLNQNEGKVDVTNGQENCGVPLECLRKVFQ